MKATKKKRAAAKPKKKRSPDPGHVERFNQLLDDAVFARASRPGLDCSRPAAVGSPRRSSHDGHESSFCARRVLIRAAG